MNAEDFEKMLKKLNGVEDVEVIYVGTTESGNSETVFRVTFIERAAPQPLGVKVEDGVGAEDIFGG